MNRIRKTHRTIGLLLRLFAAAMLFCGCSLSVFAAYGDAEPSSEAENAETSPRLSIFEGDFSSALSVSSDSGTVDLYKFTLFADVNGDGRFNVSDTRLMLRISAKLEVYSGDILLFDVSGDGVFSVTDARLSLRANALLDAYYFDEYGSLYSGFLSGGDGVYYIDRYGRMFTGYNEIDGAYYYFGSGGIMQTGFVTANGKSCYFDEDGKGVSGFYTVGSDKYYFENGIACTGLKDINGSDYYFDNRGVMQTGYVEIDGKTCYFNENGVKSLPPSKLISVSTLCQYPDYPTGCEVVSAVMALNYYGFDVTAGEFISVYLPLGSAPYKSGGVWYGSDPNKYFLGDPSSSDSYGIWAQGLSSAIFGYTTSNGGGYDIKCTYSETLDSLCEKYIAEDIPVIVWVTEYMASPHENVTAYIIGTNKTFTWISPNHCMLLVGYDSEYYYFNDPITGNTEKYEKSVSQTAFKGNGSQAVIIIPAA